MTKRSESVTSREIAGFIPAAEVGTALGLLIDSAYGLLKIQ
jgi:hypothetical protein